MDLELCYTCVVKTALHPVGTVGNLPADLVPMVSTSNLPGTFTTHGISFHFEQSSWFPLVIKWPRAHSSGNAAESTRTFLRYQVSEPDLLEPDATYQEYDNGRRTYITAFSNFLS